MAGKITYWTPEDIEKLKMFYGTMPNKNLASVIGKSKQSIQWKAWELRITTLKVATRKHCVDCGAVLSRNANYTDGRENPSIRCRECAAANHSGENHHNWKGGIAALRSLVHIILKPVWIEPIMKRDGYTCQICNKRGGEMHVHHMIPYRIIRDRIVKDNPEISVDTFEGKKELAAKIVAAHKLSYGITLCVECHKDIHSETRSELLELPESLDCYNVTGNGKRERMKNIKDWAISSQAVWKQVEGSTTNAHSPEVWAMKRHEHSAPCLT